MFAQDSFAAITSGGAFAPNVTAGTAISAKVTVLN
jgi:hypothetical protein